jgi:hypothetical protein
MLRWCRQSWPWLENPEVAWKEWKIRTSFGAHMACLRNGMGCLQFWVRGLFDSSWAPHWSTPFPPPRLPQTREMWAGHIPASNTCTAPCNQVRSKQTLTSGGVCHNPVLLSLIGSDSFTYQHIAYSPPKRDSVCVCVCAWSFKACGIRCFIFISQVFSFNSKYWIYTVFLPFSIWLLG